MRQAIVILCLSLGSVSLHAQTRLGAGVFLGRQPSEAGDETARVLSGVTMLVEGNRLGIDAAFEYADSSSGGAVLVTHGDALLRVRTGERYSLRMGGGPTYVNVENSGSETAWNAFAELGRRTGRGEAFVRVRQFDYEIFGFRSRTSPGGPAVYLGYRFAIR